MKKSFIVFLFAFSIINWSCNPACEKAFSDLITGFLLQGAVTILANTSFDIPNFIDNVQETVQTCNNKVVETETAPESDSRMVIDKDTNSDNVFDSIVISNSFAVNKQIPSGNRASVNYGFNFKSPGTYRLITGCDDSQKVTERNEKNNLSKEQGASVRANDINTLGEVIIHVLPNPNYTWQPGTPMVEITQGAITLQKIN